MDKQRVIIFGGPDRTGKTTIAKEVAKFLNIPYFKPTGQRDMSLRDPSVFEMQTRWGEPKLLDFLRQTGCSAVMDRVFPCDWVYSRAFQRLRAPEWAGTIQELDDQYGKLGALMVFTVRKSYVGWADDANPLIGQEKLEELDRLYREYRLASRCNTLLLETDDQDLKRQVFEVLNALEVM